MVFLAIRLILARNGDLLEIKPIADEQELKARATVSQFIAKDSLKG